MVVDIARAIGKLTQPLRRRVMLMIGRAVLNLVNDAGGIQLVQLSALADETLGDVPHVFDYGFTANPHPGADAVIASIGGNRNATIAIKIDDRRYRLKGLAEGEVALYDDLGQKVYLKRNGVRIDSPLNIYLNTDGVLRLEGDGVEIHGRTYVQTDVAGFGDRRTHSGGVNYADDTYTTGNVTTGAEHGLDQPHLPSDHPEGP